MLVTLKEILSLPSLEKARVVTGFKNLSKPVRWPHICDLPDAENWVKGGEFLLTTAISFGHNPDLQEELIQKLSDKKVAAIGIAVGRYIDKIPENIIKKANSVDLTLVEIPWDIPFVDITREIGEKIIGSELMLLEKMEKFRNQLMDVALSGEGLGLLAQTLSQLISNPCFIVNEHLQIVIYPTDFGTKEREIKKLLGAFSKSNRSQDLIKGGDKKSSNILDDRGEKIGAFAPIVAQGDLLGYLIVFEKNKKMDKVDYLVLEYGATVAALEILKKSKDERALDRLESDFVHDLIFSEDMTEQNAAERALFLKFDPAAPHIIVTIDIGDFSDYLRKSQVSSEVDIQILKQKLFYTAHKKLSDSHLKFVSSRRSDKIVFVIEVGESYDLTPIKDIFEELRDHIARNFQDITVSVGISSLCMSVEHIPKGYRETEKAIKIGRILSGKNKVTCFDELGVYQILFNLKEDEEIKDFIERQIGRLLKLKNNKRNELTHTLNTYIELGGNTSKTAEALFVHRNTLNYRLRTLNNLLKQDLHNPHTLLNLAIALKLLRLQNK